MKTKTLKPARAYMGKWKWLSYVLLIICMIILVPYIPLAGQFHSMAGDREITNEIFDCTVKVQYQIRSTRVRVTARIDPACSQEIFTPTLVLTTPDQKLLRSAELTGVANSLRGRLTFPEHMPEGTSLTLVFQATNGKKEYIELN